MNGARSLLEGEDEGAEDRQLQAVVIGTWGCEGGQLANLSPGTVTLGGLGETLAGWTRSGAADTPGGAAQPLSTRECARERQAAAGGGAGALLARLQPRAERLVSGSWWQHHSAAAGPSAPRNHPPLPSEQPICGGTGVGAAGAAPGTRARSSLCLLACPDLAR